MRSVGWGTRVRARLLRTFKGRSRQDAAWGDVNPVSAGAPEAFELGSLQIQVTPTGLHSAGTNAPSVIYEVAVSRDGDARRWSSRYGFPPPAASARRAAEAALDELDEIARDQAGWLGRVTEGMSEDEVEAMEDSPAVKLDRRAAEWIGPELAPLRQRREGDGAWLPEGS